MAPAGKTHHGCPRPGDSPDALELIGAGDTSPESLLEARDRYSAAQRPIDEGSARRTHCGQCDRVLVSTSLRARLRAEELSAPMLVTSGDD
jgi:hypothetical protein